VSVDPGLLHGELMPPEAPRETRAETEKGLRPAE
jgi:hypothetical protein